MLEFRLEVGDEATVFFDEREARFGSQKKLGERAKPGTDFHDVIAGLNVEKRDDRTRQILVVEKVLAKAAGGVGFQFRKQSLDVAQCHGAFIAFFPFIHKEDVNNPVVRG